MLKLKKLLFTFLLGAPVVLAASDCCDNSASSSCSSDCDESPISQNLWQPHAFSNYASREILIMKGLDVDATEDKWLNRFGFATEYMQNFGHNCAGLGALPFWSGTNTMTIGNNDGLADLDAYQFGMGNVVTEDGIGGKITLSPKVQHVGTEFLWYAMQNEDKVGAYFKVKVPLGAMIMKNNLCEVPAQLTNENVYTGTEGATLFPPATFYQSLTAAFASGTYFQNPLYNYGKIECCNQTTIRLGDITAAVGANFVARENGLFGAAFKVSCPTGNVPQAVYMLEPIFGRAGHWGVGGEIQGHYRYDFNKDKCGLDYVNVWIQGEAMHLFSGRKPSWRSFDLAANGKGSKYLLIQHYKYAPDGVTFVPDYIDAAINYTTLPVVSTFAVEGNVALMIDFVRDGWNLSIGGDFWARSKERLSIDSCRVVSARNNEFYDFNLNDWAVIGRQIGELSSTVGQPNITWCQPLAKINESVARQTTTTNAFPDVVKDASLSENRIPADYNTALDICGAAAHKIYTGKVLGELGYTWSDSCHVPHVSIFGGAELSAKDSNWVNMWSVGLQGSLQF